MRGNSPADDRLYEPHLKLDTNRTPILPNIINNNKGAVSVIFKLRDAIL